MDLIEQLRKQVNRSGFPLQIAVEHAVSSYGGNNGWQIYSREHSWKNKDSGTSGFIDLVLIDRYKTSIMVLECKRVLNSHWIFLNPTSQQKSRRNAKSWITLMDGVLVKRSDWMDIAVDPSTPESDFCIVAGQDTKSRPMIERVASDLTEATESFAIENLAVMVGERVSLRIYFNVIVTTAELMICDFLPDTISLVDGTLDQTNFQTVPYLRFRKQLSVNRTVQNIDRIHGNSFREKENTVFIVNSQNLLRFLEEFEVDDSFLSRMA